MDVIALSGSVLISIPTSLRGDYSKNGQGDTGYIKGIITEKEIPVSRRVMCYHRATGILVGSVWSGVDGGYTFTDLIADVDYFITAVDEHVDAVQYNAVTQDLVTASEVII